MDTNDFRFSVCQLGLPDSGMEEDLQLCADLGIECLSLDERKMVDGGDEALLAKMAESGIKAGICAPATLSILPSPVLGGSPEPEDRLEEICASIRRFAPFRPASVFVVTGPLRDLEEGHGRAIVVEGLRAALSVADAVGVTLSIEPMRVNHGHYENWTFINSIRSALSLIDDVGANLKITYDVWHLWDSAEVEALTRAHASSVAGVQISDYRQPTRTQQDRLLPGDGVINLPSLFAALEAGGFRGWYDLEVFSDRSLPDSIWNRPPHEWVAAGREGFMKVFAAATADL